MKRTIPTPHDFVQRFIDFEEYKHKLISVIPVYNEDYNVMMIDLVCTSVIYAFSFNVKGSMLKCKVYQRNIKKESSIFKKYAFYLDKIPFDCPVITDYASKEKIISFD